MNTALWVVQVLLAVVYLGSGIAKSTMSKERLMATGQTGVAPFSLPAIRLIAVSEILGSVGVVLPWASGIGRPLTPTAAVGFVLLMIGAAISHWTLREYRQALAVNLPLALLAGFVAGGRFAGL